MLPTTLNQLAKGFVCYAITAPSLQPAPVFIGTARLCDLFDISDARRNNEFRRIVGNDTVINVQILSHHDRDEAARSSAGAYITAYKPYCNLNGTATPARGARVRNVTNGEIFANASEAARCLGVTRSAISQHLNNRDAMPTVAGYTLERMT